MSSDHLVAQNYRNILRQDINLETQLDFDNIAIHDLTESPANRFNDSAPSIEIIEVENFQTKSPIIVDLERDEKFKKIEKCTAISDILQHFESINPDVENIEEHLLLKFQFIDNFIDLDTSNLQELLRKCGKMSAVITLEASVDVKFAIYWKSKEIDEFLMLKPNLKLCLKDAKLFSQFVADFLADSLQYGHLGLYSKLSSQLGSRLIDLDLLADSRDYNLLLLSAEHGNSEVVEILFQLGMNTTSLDNKVDAQTLAMNGQHFDVLYVLLMHNLKFPRTFAVNRCTSKMKEFCNDIEEVHKLIKENQNKKLEKILPKYKNLKYFYDFKNNSALKVSILYGSYESYDLLLSKKFRFAPHENPAKYLQKLEEDDKEIVREIHNRHSEHLVDKHINVLIANSFIHNDEVDGQDKQDIISRAYKTINTNSLIRIILMIVAASKNFKIIFDFNRESVDVADPTVDSYTQGLFYVSGRIYIGAKSLLNSSTEHETLANLAHELCHFAMNLVYNNGANPYKIDDHKTSEEFEKISKKCQVHYGKEEVVDTVYDAYPTDMHHAELIVRVIHLHALFLNQPEKLQKAQQIHENLFEFFEKKILPELKQALPEIEGREEKELKRKDKKISKFKKLSLFCGLLSVLGIVAAIIVGLVLYTPFYVFDELSFEDRLTVIKAPIIYKNTSLMFCDLFADDSSIYGQLTSDHISQMLEDVPLDFDDPHLHYLEEQVSHKWENLAEKLRKKFLTSNFTFQNESLKFKDLYDLTSVAFKSLKSDQIIKVLDDEEPIVHEMIKNETNFYVERKIFDESIYAIYYQFMEFLQGDESPSKCLFWNNTGSSVTFDNFYDNFINQSFDIQFEKVDKIKNSAAFRECGYSNFDVTSEVHWNDSNGRLTSLKVTDTLFSHDMLQIDFDQVLKIANKSKMFILSDEAGTGKTVTFEQFTMRIKKKFPTRWVSYVDLKDHKNFYKGNKTLMDVKSMLAAIFELSSDNEFELRIFEELFDSGNVILLWNGFDEISPEFSDNVIRILRLIKTETQNIQFICTRPIYSEILRNEFKIRTYTLVPFDEEAQNNFIEKFFVTQNIENSKIPNFIQKVQKIIKNTESKDDFNTPLVLLMIADIISKNIEIYETENLYEIYRKFVEKKVEIWEQKSEFAKKFLKSLITNDFSVKKFYQKFAIKSELQQSFAFFNSLKLKIMRQKVPKELTSDEISRMGILYINGPKNFKFAHKTYAEFFVAQFLIENLYNTDDEPTDEEAELRIEMFYYCFTEPGIARFLGYFLDTDGRIGRAKRGAEANLNLELQNKSKKLQNIQHLKFPTLSLDKEPQNSNPYLKILHKRSTMASNHHKELQSFDQKISKLFTTKFQKFIINSLQQRMLYTKFLILLLNFLKKDHKVLTNLLQIEQDETFYTASFNSYYFMDLSFRNFDRNEIKKFAELELTESEYKKFINGMNQKGVITYGLYYFHKSKNSIGTSSSIGFGHDEYLMDQKLLDSEDPVEVFDEISKNLTEFEYKELLTSTALLIPVPLPDTDVNIFNEKFYTKIDKILTIEEQKSWISSNFAAFFIARHKPIYNLILKKVAILFTNSEIFKLFSDSKILHITVASDSVSFPIIWNFFVNHSTFDQQKSILMQNSQIECHYDPVSYLRSLPRCHYFPSLNILHASLFVNVQIVKEEKLRNFKKIKEIYENYFSKEEIQDIVASSSDFLTFLIVRKEREVCEGFVAYLKEIFDKNEEKLNKFLSQKVETTNVDVFEILNNFSGFEDKVKLFLDPLGI